MIRAHEARACARRHGRRGRPAQRTSLHRAHARATSKPARPNIHPRAGGFRNRPAMVDIEIEYEVNEPHNAHAVKLTEALLAQFGKQISFIKIIPSHEGKFDIAVDGEITFTLMMENRLPSVKEICDQVHERLRTTGRI
jgi:predicted Rdx family selenoprotein